MATLSGISLSAPRAPSKLAQPSRPLFAAVPQLNYHPWKRSYQAGARRGMVVAAAPEKIGDKVAESIKNAEEACAGDPVSGECVAAWDEVEELSATASHLREKKKDSDPLETFCKDNPESEECRTYDN